MEESSRLENPSGLKIKLRGLQSRRKLMTRSDRAVGILITSTIIFANSLQGSATLMSPYMELVTTVGLLGICLVSQFTRQQPTMPQKPQYPSHKAY